MAQFTNTAGGPRGLNLKNGTTRWLEAGETVELNKADIAADHPEIQEGKAAAKEAAKADDGKE